MTKHRTLGKLIVFLGFLCLIQLTFLTYKGFNARVLVYTERFNHPKEAMSLFPSFNFYNLEPGWTDKAVLLGDKKPNKRFMTLGIVTAQRPNGTVYLFKTLDSLLKNSEMYEQREFRVVVLLADQDLSWKNKMIETLQTDYKEELNNGTIHVLQSFEWMYPKLDNLTHHYSFHSKDRVRWKAKQNIDFALLWLYVHKLNISTYYLHLEDDLLTVKGYFQMMKDYIKEQTRPWVCLEFSVLGMIAKLYHTKDLESLAKIVTLFYEEQPADFTYINFNSQMLQFHRLVRKPTLFQHIGYTSSLKEKSNNKNYDKFFLGEVKNGTVNNPAAKIKTNLSFQKDWPPDHAYNSPYGFYSWTNKEQKEGDYFDIIFKSKVKVKRIEVLTGDQEFPLDFLKNGTLQYSLDDIAENAQCKNFVSVANFKNGTVDAKINNDIPEIKCFRILVNGRYTHWLIIRKIIVHH